MFDINSVTVNDTHDLSIVHPVTGEDTGMVVTVYGRDSETFIAANRKQQQLFLKTAGREPEVVAKEVGYAFVADCVKGWSGVSENGEEVEFSKDKFVEVCSKHRWLFDQVDRAIIKRELFIEG